MFNQGHTIVIVCIDLDEHDKEHNKKNEEIKKYCSNKGYKYVWFNRNIEEVFLGKKISNNVKNHRKSKFCKRSKIKNIDISKYKCLKPSQYKTSNLVLVTDEIIKE